MTCWGFIRLRRLTLLHLLLLWSAALVALEAVPPCLTRRLTCSSNSSNRQLQQQQQYPQQQQQQRLRFSPAAIELFNSVGRARWTPPSTSARGELRADSRSAAVIIAFPLLAFQSFELIKVQRQCALKPETKQQKKIDSFKYFYRQQQLRAVLA